MFFVLKHRLVILRVSLLFANLIKDFEQKFYMTVLLFRKKTVKFFWFMLFGRMFKLVLNVKYLLLLSFLTAAEFYNLRKYGIRVH